MPTQEFITLGEVAAFLGWTPRFVERLAVGGKLPGLEVNGQWRFRREELVDWLDQKIQTLDAARIEELEHTLEGELEAEGILPRPHPAPLASRLQPAGIALDLRTTAKGALLRELVALAENTGDLLDRKHLHASLVEREGLYSTALPGGVAICHPRRPLSFALRDTLLCFARTAVPIPFGAEDGEPTQLFFLLAALDDRAHLHGLARLVRVLRGSTLDTFRRAPTAQDVIAILRAREAALDAAAG